MRQAILEWSTTSEPLWVPNEACLRAKLEEIHARALRPVIATLRLDGVEMAIGLGMDRGFVHVDRLEGYSITLGEETSEMMDEFYLHDDHRVEIPRMHLVEAEAVFDVVAEFFQNGTFSTGACWDHVSYEPPAATLS